MRAYRLLLSGELMPARAQIDAAHLLVAYTAEDDCGQTDMYIALPGHGELPDDLRAYLAAALYARALDLEAAAEPADQIAPEAAPGLRDVARTLAASAAQISTIADYTTAWHEVVQPIQSILIALDDTNGTLMATEAADTICRILSLIAG